jgi:putative membrane protein
MVFMTRCSFAAQASESVAGLMSMPAAMATQAWLPVSMMPFNEIRLIRAGNNAAGIVLGGVLVALAIPLAATLASSHVTLDIIVWGAIALAIQLIAFFAVAAVLHGLRGMIEQGNTAAATLLVGIQIAVALLNAGAVAG